MINPNYNYTNPISSVNTVNIAKGVPHPIVNRNIIREVDDNIYKAIDLARDRLIEQVKREQGRKRHTSRTRKEAAQMRDQMARSQMTVEREPWEDEVQESEY